MEACLPARVALRTTLRTLGDAPCRSVDALRARCRVEVLPLLLESSEVEAPAAAPPPAAPLFAMTVPSDPSRAPQTRLHSKRARAARKSGTCCKTSC